MWKVLQCDTYSGDIVFASVVGTTHRLHQAGRVLSIAGVVGVDFAVGLLHDDGQDHAVVNASVAGYLLNGVVDVTNTFFGVACSIHRWVVAVELVFVSRAPGSFFFWFWGKGGGR